MLRFTSRRNEWKPWSDMTMKTTSFGSFWRSRPTRSSARRYTFSIESPYFSASAASYIGCLGSMSRHIMCWMRSVVSIAATNRSQSSVSSRLRIIFSRSSIARSES